MKVSLKNVRLSFPHLFMATPFKPGDDPKFKATFLIPKNDPQHEVIEAAIRDIAKAKWGAKADSIIKSIRGNPNKFNYQDGDTKSYDGYEGMMALTASNKVRPMVIDRIGVRNDGEKESDRSYTQPNSKGVMFPILTPSDGKPYAGCYVYATVEFFTYNSSGNGISASLKGVQYYREGDAFGGGASASPEDFDDLGVEEEEDSLAG